MKPSSLAQSPAVLLVVTGALIGLNFPLGKLAGEAAISPMIWALLVSLGASSFLLPVLLVQGRLRLLTWGLARYAILSGLITFVAANLLVFATIPKVGSGYTGVMFATSPVFTLAFSAVVGLRTPGALGLAGIALGLAGAVIVTLTRQASGGVEAAAIWYLAAFLIPVTLAIGNVYRTIAWPEGAEPDVLAFWSHAASAAIFVVLILLTSGSLPLGELARAPEAAFAQAVVAGLTFPVFFRLQQAGGPVLLSQIGYVAAAVGLAAAVLFLGESYGTVTWIGAGVIAAGIFMTILAQQAPR